MAKPAAARGSQGAGRTAPCGRLDARLHRRCFGRASRCRSTTCRRAGSPPARSRSCSGRIASTPTTGRPTRATRCSWTCRRTRRPIPSCWSRPRRTRGRDTRTSFTRFCALFPDRFYVSERGRMFLTNPREIASDAEGHRLLSAGFHSQMGYFRDDRPLYELVLDDGAAASAGRPVEGARLHHARARPAVQAVHLVRARRAAKLHGHRAVQRVPLRRRRRDVRSEDRAAGRRLPGQGASDGQRRRPGRGPRLFRPDERERARAGSGEGGRRTQSPRRAARVRAAGLSPAADEAGGGRPARLLPIAARSASQSRGGDSRRGGQRADVAALLLPRRPLRLAIAGENARRTLVATARRRPPTCGRSRTTSSRAA